MDIIKELKALKPEVPDDEVASDVDQIRKANPAITDEQILEQAQVMVKGGKPSFTPPPAAPPPLSPNAGATPPAAPAGPLGGAPTATMPPMDGMRGVTAPPAPGSDAGDGLDPFKQGPVKSFTGNDAAIAALQGLAGVGDAIGGAYGGNKTNYLGTSIENERKGQELDLTRRKLIADTMKDKRSEGRDDAKLALERQKVGADVMKAQLDAMQKGGKDKFEMEEKLRDGFTNASKTFTVIRDQYGILQGAAKNPSAAGDLALIFAYMKLVDPGSSVREGEFSNAQNSAGVPDRVRNMYNNALNGQRFAPETRADFVKSATQMFQTQQKTFEGTKAMYDDLAKSYQLDPKKVTEIVVGHEADQGGSAPAAAPMTATNKKTGEKIVSHDGGKTWQPTK